MPDHKMSDLPNQPKSPTLLPPRNSVGLEDSGAHDLSDNEDDLFADAEEGEGIIRRPTSPIPRTRVEKVDDRESHGEVPGTAAYRMREQDAVPDDIEIIPENQLKQFLPRAKKDLPPSPTSPVPMTVVEKVDPATVSHGDVPGTALYMKRKVDAIPDVVIQAPKPGEASLGQDRGDISPEVTVPTTVAIKVDPELKHGEVPGTEAYDLRHNDAKPDVIGSKGDISSLPTTSRSKAPRPRFKDSGVGDWPIAADGGFGPMGSEISEDEGDASGQDLDTSPNSHDEGTACSNPEANSDQGEDFDDFEAGAADDDFGDFDGAFQETSSLEPEPVKSKSFAVRESSLPLLDFKDLDTIKDIIAAIDPYLDEIFPSAKTSCPDPPPPPSNTNSMFLTDRGLSLWSQLVAPPPLQPPNWVRSRIRRLFLVSLGVPVDLDEILPASKQKKLILPSTDLRADSQSPSGGQRAGSRVRLKQENVSSTSIDQATTSSKSRKRKGPSPAPDLDLHGTRILCATTEAALSIMTDSELQMHVKQLEDLTLRASKVLEYWLKRKDSAVGDKEAFEGVIENMVKHARRVRN